MKPMTEREGLSAERPRLVLVSASPRRRWLLEKLGVPFEVLAADIEERAAIGEAPDHFAQRMADEKAAAALVSRPAAWLLAADTVVAIGGEALGKPCDARQAEEMLARLAGSWHTVYTGVTLCRPGGVAVERRVVATRVSFRELVPAEIIAYIASGEPFDRAGAYAIQGEGAHLIDHVEGSYTNVIGLPLPEVTAWLRAWRLL